MTFERFVSAQMHCHSSIEGPASIGAHCYEARRAGVEVVWLTDHDTRISLYAGGPFISAFDFEAPDLMTRLPRSVPGGGIRERQAGWTVVRRDEGLAAGSAALTRERCFGGSQSMLLEARGGDGNGAGVEEWQDLMVRFDTEGNFHRKSLLSDLTVGVAAYVEHAAPEAAAWMDLVLCEQPPDLRQTRLRYLLAGDPNLAQTDPDERARVHLIPLLPAQGTWQRFEVRPADAAAGDGLGGIDNALTSVQLGLRVRRGAAVKLFVDDLTLTHRYEANALHARQRQLAAEQAARYGVVCHVAQEISQAGVHKNTWGSAVTLLDYAGTPNGFDHAGGVAWAQQHAEQHGTVWGLNHPFSAYNRRTDLDDAARERELQKVLDRHVADRASGAHTLEVGFPAGRHQFALDYYLRLWDGLSAQGIHVAGIGSSDAHSARVGWQTGNNFATYIRADSPAEAEMLAGLRARDVYIADPVRFRSRLSFGDRAGHRMGQVVPGPSPSQEVVLTLERTQPSWVLCCVVDGQRQPPVPLPEASAPTSFSWLAETTRDTFVRAEVWDTACAPDGSPRDPVPGDLGRCIALTNPIWYEGLA